MFTRCKPYVYDPELWQNKWLRARGRKSDAMIAQEVEEYLKGKKHG